MEIHGRAITKNTYFFVSIHIHMSNISIDSGEDIGDKIELIVSLCHKLSDILKDPTEAGAKELPADKRSELREEAHDELLICINVLANCAHYYHGFFDVVNIASKYKVELDEKK